MSEKIRVQLAGPTSLVIDRAGHKLAPGEQAAVDPGDPVTHRALSSGALVPLPEATASEPDTTPARGRKARGDKQTGETQ